MLSAKLQLTTWRVTVVYII